MTVVGTRRDGITAFSNAHWPAISAVTCSQMVKADGTPCQSRMALPDGNDLGG